MGGGMATGPIGDAEFMVCYLSWEGNGPKYFPQQKSRLTGSGRIPPLLL